MAQEYFYSLRDKKRTRILDAIEKCMQTFDYDKLSINDIINEADISRGSFYNYFVDKNDAVETLVREKINFIYEIFKKNIMNNDNNLFDGIYHGYYEIKDMLHNKVFVTIMKNLKYFIDIGVKVIYSKSYEEEMIKIIDWLIEHTNEGKTIINTRDKMANIVDILVSLISNISLKIIISNNDENNDGFDYKYNIVKTGVLNMKSDL